MIPTSDFFNKLAKHIDEIYFPTVTKHTNKECATVHYAIELFNNGCLTYHELVKRLAKACNEETDVIHSITKQYIVDFGGYIYNEVEALNNFASKFGMVVNVFYQEDRRRKSTYFLTLGGTSISPQLDYNGINNFLLGWNSCVNKQ
jgi:hypothetical protein